MPIVGQTAFPGAVDTLTNLIRVVNKTASLYRVASPGVDANATTIPIDPNTTEAPSDGTCWINGEYVSFTGKTSNSITGCSRGFDGSTRNAHGAGEVVYFDAAVARQHNVLAEALVAVETALALIMAGGGGGGFGPEEASLTGDLPILTLESDSNTDADQSTIRLRRADAGGGGTLSENATLLGRLLIEAKNQNSAWFPAAAILTGLLGPLGIDETASYLEIRVNDGNAAGNITIAEPAIAMDGSTGSIKINARGGDGTGELQLNAIGSIRIKTFHDIIYNPTGAGIFDVGDRLEFSAPVIKFTQNFIGYAILDFNSLSADQTAVWPDTSGTFGVLVSPPATATSAGVPGAFACDTSFAYFCVAANTWRRVAISSW